MTTLVGQIKEEAVSARPGAYVKIQLRITRIYAIARERLSTGREIRLVYSL